MTGGLYRGLVRSPAPAVVDVIDSVAVLPFENVGGDPDREYLSDGIADTLINELSRLPNLRVIARSTSFRFRGSEVDPRKVGRDLGVGAVLTGRVSQRGDTLVIGAELVDVGPGDAALGRAIQHQNGRPLRRTGGHRRRHLARTAAEAGAQGRRLLRPDATPRTPKRIGSIS